MAALVSDLQWHYTAICWDGFYLTGTRDISGLGPNPEKSSQEMPNQQETKRNKKP